MFSPDERIIYNRKCRETIAYLDADLSSGVPGRGSFINTLQRINALRMVCNLSAYRLPLTTSTSSKALWTLETTQEAFNELHTVGQTQCFYCQEEVDSTEEVGSPCASEDVSQPQLTECFILWCGKCVKPSEVKSYYCRSPCASFCVSPLQLFVLLYDNDLVLHSSDTDLPSKIKALQQDLTQQSFDTKSIVFSFWKTTLDVVEVALRRISCQYVYFDGRVTASKRRDVLDAFKSDPNVKVLLLSISCGAVGLNLTAASRAYIMEPH